MGSPLWGRRVSGAHPLVSSLVLLVGLLLVPIPASEQQPRTLYVNNADPTCQGQTPCYATIQGLL